MTDNRGAAARDPTVKLSFNRERVERLRQTYNAAVKVGMTSFMFDGHEFLTSYAKYVLEYLDNQFDTYEAHYNEYKDDP